MNNGQTELSTIGQGYLDVAIVLRLTYASLEQNYHKLMSSVGMPLLVYVLSDLMFGIWVLQDPETNQLSLNASLFFGIIDGFIWLLIAVRTHRVIMADKISRGDGRRLSNSDSYFWFAIRITLLAITFMCCILSGWLGAIFVGQLHMVVGLIVSILIVILTISVSIYGVWQVSRLFLCLPSIAVKQMMSLSESFALTREHQVLMFSVVYVFPLVVYTIPTYAFSMMFDSSLVLVVLLAILSLVVTIAEVAVLSMTYVYVMDQLSKDLQD